MFKRTGAVGLWGINTAVGKNGFLTSDISVYARNQDFIKSDLTAKRECHFEHFLGIALATLARSDGIADMTCVFFKIIVEFVSDLKHSDESIIALANENKLCGLN